jgi:heme/copper-type cytochrome/quinol oxidase subunit 3
MHPRPAIDVAELPGTAFDSQAPVWWGNTLLMTIETVTVMLLVLSYFYVIQNFEVWPPVSGERPTPRYEPLPDLHASTWCVALIIAATAPMIWADRASRKLRAVPTVAALLLAVLASGAAIIFRIQEFKALQFWYDENAYASIVWALLFMHLLYLILEVAEAGIDIVWIVVHGLDEKLAVDVTLSTAYWYWTVTMALIVYGVVYWSPRLL